MNKSGNKFGGNKSTIGKYIPKIAIIGVLFVVAIIFNIITSGTFLSSGNVIAVLSHAVVPLLMACSMCFIVTAGRLDLSLGSILVLSSNLAAIGALNIGGYIGLLIGGMGSTILFVVFNTLIVQKLKVPAWVTGLAMAMIYEGLAGMYSSAMIADGKRVATLGEICRGLGRSPALLIVCVIAIIIAYFMFNNTSCGINIRAIGGNPQVSGMMGINLKTTELMSGVLGGLFLGIAAMINISSNNSIVPTSGLTSLASVFQPLAIYFLAEALQKWFNMIIGLMVSSVFIMGLFNFLTRMKIPSGTWQDIVLGAIIIVVGIVAMRGHKGVVK